MYTKNRFKIMMAVLMVVSLLASALPALAADPPSGVFTVQKKVLTSYDRAWEWTIEKTADVSELTLSLGQQYLVNYTVTLTATPVDENVKVWGNILGIHTFPFPEVVKVTDVTDTVSPEGVDATVNCQLGLPFNLPNNWAFICTYEAWLTAAVNGTNTATFVTDHGDFSDTESVVFGAPVSELDECVDVIDDKYGPLGTVCAGDADKTFNYSMLVGPYDVCGPYQFMNTASFETNDSKTTGSSKWTVDINVPCEGGCTLTPGYWKTHSKYGPAPYDSLWGTNGEFDEDTAFYLSGQSYYEVLWTNPRGGNAYYILAHAFIAARLNLLNDAASTPAVDAALLWSDVFFNTFTPSTNLSKEMRDMAIAYAGLLDDYNNGYIGPGHCSE